MSLPNWEALWISVALASAGLVALPVARAEPQMGRGETVAPEQVDEKAHTGTLVSASGNEFTMKDDSGSMHSHTLATDAKVTDPNGEPCRISDLKAGQKISVTTEAGNPKVARKVECVV